jgi:glycosyltransferase involved in cell wall biosynthesis
MSDDLVSVIIPVYNSEQFLEKCIQSVLNQTHTSLDIVAIDDGSTDNSLEILNQYSDRITVISQKNHGLGFSLNIGTRKIRGQWFKWFSPDDVLYPEAISLSLTIIKNQDQNSIVYSNWDMIDDNDKKLRTFTESNFNDLSTFEFNTRLLDGQQINVNTALIPSSLVSNGCYFRNLVNPAAIDYDFFLRAGLLFSVKFYLIQKPLMAYRINKWQLSHQNITSALSYVENIKNEVLSMLDEKSKTQYLVALKNYRKNKSLTRKTMDFGLQLSTKYLPKQITDTMLVFYLNKLRRKR